MYLWGMLKSRRRGRSPDPELADDGMKDRPDTTFGTMNDDVLAHFDADFRREDFVSIITQSAWPEVVGVGILFAMWNVRRYEDVVARCGDDPDLLPAVWAVAELGSEALT